MKQRVGFIGLGKMGRPMSRNLLKAGFSLTVYDRDERSVQELVRLGAQAIRSPKELAGCPEAGSRRNLGTDLFHLYGGFGREAGAASFGNF